MKISKQIKQYIESIAQGEPFTATELLRFGSRATVDQTLSRLAKAGLLTRVSRGVYVRAKESRYVGKVVPEPFSIARAVARSTGAIFQVHGAEAARRLELTTQVPTQPIFQTTGPTRRLRVGQLEILLQHVSQRKLTLAGTPAGLALAALWYLGQQGVTSATIAAVRKKLGPEEFEAFRMAAPSMPAWMSDAIHRSERDVFHG